MYKYRFTKQKSVKNERFPESKKKKKRDKKNIFRNIIGKMMKKM